MIDEEILRHILEDLQRTVYYNPFGGTPSWISYREMVNSKNVTCGFSMSLMTTPNCSFKFFENKSGGENCIVILKTTYGPNNLNFKNKFAKNNFEKLVEQASHQNAKTYFFDEYGNLLKEVISNES